ncbi:MAG: AbrB/MazE/SpoVT family DNA-binding domain-containing protein [Candidatus Methylopumilus sp.]|jgi:putative addiction module antidote
MVTLKLIEVDDSLGVVLPEELLAKMKLRNGDDLYVTYTDNGITLSPYKLDSEDQQKLGRGFMGEYRDTFKALAK